MSMLGNDLKVQSNSMSQITSLFVCDDHGVPASDDGEIKAIDYAKDFKQGALDINKALSWVQPANALIIEMYARAVPVRLNFKINDGSWSPKV